MSEMSLGPGPVLKKPKIEKEESVTTMADENGAQNDREEQEEALVALIEHRTKEVEHLHKRLAYYKTQLDQAERRLEDSQVKLARLRSRDNLAPSKSSLGDGMKNVKVEQTSTSPTQISEDSFQNQPLSKPQYAKDYIKPIRSSLRNGEKDVKIEQRSTNDLQIREGSQNQSHSKPQLVIPAVNPKVSQPMKMAEPAPKASSGSGSRHKSSVPTQVNSPLKVKGDSSHRNSSEQEAVEIQSKGTKRKFEQKEHKDLIQMIYRSSSPRTINCQTGTLISSQHKRKLRSLVLCPTNDQLFVTSALDGIVNLWQIQGRGSSASFLSSTDCASVKQRRWPEDIAWHPQGNSLFSVYSADGGDSQIAVLNLNKIKEKSRVSFLENKPHVKGIINNIVFMPWEDTCFVTGGSDHAVVRWSEKDGEENSWKPKALHRSMHSSAVMGVAGMQQKQIVISVGADKRIIGFDLLSGRGDYKHQIESKCMSVLPNPCDFNLFMVQTGTPERQLRLFDYRVRQMEIHAFGWKQESSESQSALINQAWSPDGLYITSGSADPMIHIFDIRYNAAKPTQSIRAHHKRVFKAVWHHNLPLLISISSDLNIGLHKIM